MIDTPQDSSAATFEAVRGRLFGLAYRMLGSRAEAEDVVQEAYLRWHEADRSTIRSPEAWLVTVATRLAIDRLRALQAGREAYVGPWLPEPIMSDAPPPDRALEVASDLSVAFLVLLERLGPEERAAFLLHEVFETGYAEIAQVLGRSEAACRQLVHRARERVRSERTRFAVDERARARLLRTFVAAVEARDENTLLKLFTPDATWTADGGGRVPASPRAIVGGERIAKLVLGLQKGLERDGASLHLVAVNGETGICVRVGERITGVLTVSCDADRIYDVFVIVNPEKLGSNLEPRTSNLNLN